MSFSDLSTPAGLQSLEKFLAEKSFVEGSSASQADVAVFNGLAPSADKYPNVARWFKHIASYVPEFSTLPGDKSATASTVGGSAAAAPAAEEEDDDDVDLFGSDEEDDEEAERIKAERVAEYNKRKAGKPKAAAKSMVTLEVKPWDDETPLEEMLKQVKSIEMDGLLWGASKWVPIGYGIKKLQINCVIEDDKVSLDDLQEQIQEFEDYVQSTDVAAMQKI